MAAEAKARILLECTGLGGGTVTLPPTKFTDTNTPDDYRRIDTTISTTAGLISTLVNVPSSDIVGIGLVARGDTVYFNTISANISTAGMAVPEGQAIFITSELSNSCVFAYKGNAISAAVSLLYYATIA